MGRFAVLILNWNGEGWLQHCLQAALAQPADDVWLVDNGSSDGSVALVHQKFPEVRVMQLDRNYGFGGAYNRAIAAIDAPYVALLNNDTRVSAGWLAELVEAIEHQPDVAAVGSKLVYLERPLVVNHAGGRLTPLGAAFDIGFGSADGACFDTAGPVGCATGAAMLVRRAAFAQIGGFDEQYFAYFDDVDLCWRLWLAGYRVDYQPKAVVLHAYGGSATGGRLSTLRLEHCQTNRLQNMFKHLQTRTLLAMLPVSIAYDAARVAQLAGAGHLEGVRALVRGTRRFAKLLPRVLDERRRIQARRRRSDRDLLEIGALASLGESVREWRRLGGLSVAPPASGARDTTSERA